MNRIQERSRELVCSKKTKRPATHHGELRLPGQQWWMDTVTRPLPTDRRPDARRNTHR